MARSDTASRPHELLDRVLLRPSATLKTTGVNGFFTASEDMEQPDSVSGTIRGAKGRKARGEINPKIHR